MIKAVSAHLTFRRMMRISQLRPLNLNLETCTVCNSRCVFCGYSKCKRTFEVMELDLFSQIIDEYAKIGGSIGFSPLMSDPLMDPLILERIRLISKKGLWTHMFTNAIGFNKFSDDEIKLFLSLNHINISLSGPDSETYKSMYGVDKFEQVYMNIIRLHNLRKLYNSSTRIALHFRIVDIDRFLKSDFVRKLQNLGFSCNNYTNTFTTFGGVVSQSDVPDGVKVIVNDNSNVCDDCLIPQAEMTIVPNGDVVACGCFDTNGATIVANIKKQSIINAWQSKKYNYFRTGFSRRAPESICLNCAGYISVRKIFSDSNLKGYDPRKDNFWVKLSDPLAGC